MSYRGRRQSFYDVRVRGKPWLVVRRKGKSPISVVAGAHFKTREEAEKEVDTLNKNYKGSDIKFLIRPEGWRDKKWYS
jgi:hypothetical protein